MTGSVTLPTTPVPTPPSCTEDSDEVVAFHSEPLAGQLDLKPLDPSPPLENLMPQYQAVLERRSKRKASDEDGHHIPRPPPAKRPRRDPTSPLYLRPTPRQREEQTSVFSWTRWMFSRSGQ